jgi:hypothetical protein
VAECWWFVWLELEIERMEKYGGTCMIGSTKELTNPST